MQAGLARWPFSEKLTSLSAFDLATALPPRPGSPRTSGQSPPGADSWTRAAEARGDKGSLHLAGRLSVFLPFSENTRQENQPEKVPEFSLPPIRPTPDPALTGLCRRRAPRAQEALAVSAAQQRGEDASQGHVGSGQTSVAATADLEEPGHQSRAAPTRGPGPLLLSPLQPVLTWCLFAPTIGHSATEKKAFDLGRGWEEQRLNEASYWFVLGPAPSRLCTLKGQWQACQ